MPKGFIDPTRFPFKSYPFERGGKIYLKLHIRAWQNKVPDMSRIFSAIMPKKKMVSREKQSVEIMITETCVAELVHSLLCVLGLALPVIWPGTGGWIFYAVYVILGNVPFIIIQRFNRPRLMKLLRHGAAAETGGQEITA